MRFSKRRKAGQNTRDAPMWLIQLLPDEIIPEGYVSLDRSEEVRQAVNKIADLVSNMTVKVMENGENGDNRVKDGLSRRLDITPNALMTRKTFVYNVVRDLCIYGNAVAFPRVKGDFVKEILPVPMSRVSFNKTNLDAYTITVDGQTYVSDELLHFVLNPSEENPFVGEGFTPQLKRCIRDQAQAQATSSAFLKSKWKPGLIISTQSDSEELEDKEKRRAILDSYTETTEAGEPWLIPAGEIEVEKVQPLTLKDLAISESIELNKRTIAAAFGMPAFMLGVGDFNLEAYNNFIATTILSFAKIIEQELTRKLIASPTRYVEFNSRSLLQYSLADKIGYIEKMSAMGIINRNEARNELGLSPVDVDGMNEYQTLENYIPVDRLGDQKKLNGGEESE